MISDRTSCSTIYMILSILYPAYTYCFVTCFFLDFGSHFLQFCSSALMKSDSHKGKNEKENFLVKFYYSNGLFFGICVVCSEIASVFLIILNKSSYIYSFKIAHVANVILVAILTTKMTINGFQWLGAQDRLRRFDANVKV